jgi:hypothetical protein
MVCDPYQLHRSITTLQKAGLPIEEYPQTQPNLTAAGQALYDLLNGRNLRLYPSEELRAQALATVAIESPRGWRIAKEKTGKKIDAIVALAMAARAAMDGRRDQKTGGTWGRDLDTSRIARSPDPAVGTGIRWVTRNGVRVPTHPAGDDVARRILSGEIPLERARKWERDAEAFRHMRLTRV